MQFEIHKDIKQLKRHYTFTLIPDKDNRDLEVAEWVGRAGGNR